MLETLWSGDRLVSLSQLYQPQKPNYTVLLWDGRLLRASGNSLQTMEYVSLGSEYSLTIKPHSLLQNAERIGELDILQYEDIAYMKTGKRSDRASTLSYKGDGSGCTY